MILFTIFVYEIEFIYYNALKLLIASPHCYPCCVISITIKDVKTRYYLV
jgi:hypothetical protein